MDISALINTPADIIDNPFSFDLDDSSHTDTAMNTTHKVIPGDFNDTEDFNSNNPTPSMEIPNAALNAPRLIPLNNIAEWEQYNLKRQAIAISTEALPNLTPREHGQLTQWHWHLHHHNKFNLSSCPTQ